MARQNRVPVTVRTVLAKVPTARFGGILLSWRVAHHSPTVWRVHIRFENGDALQAYVDVFESWPHRGYLVIGARYRAHGCPWVEVAPGRGAAYLKETAADYARARRETNNAEYDNAVINLTAARARARCARKTAPARLLEKYLIARTAAEAAEYAAVSNAAGDEAARVARAATNAAFVAVKAASV